MQGESILVLEMSQHADFNRVVGQCQAAVAEAVEAFGRIDVLLCAASEGKYSQYDHMVSN